MKLSSHRLCGTIILYNCLVDELILISGQKPLLHLVWNSSHIGESCIPYSVATSEKDNCVVNDNRETSKSWFFDHDGIDGPSPKMSSYLYTPPETLGGFNKVCVQFQLVTVVEEQ